MRQLVKKLWGLVRGSRTITRRKTAPLWRWRPLIEALEDRLVPAAAGFTDVPPAVLTGTVFLDNNGTGLLQSGDPGIPGVAITLSGTTDQGQHISAGLNTNANGFFQFSQIQPGTYTLTRGSPINFVGEGAKAGTLGGTAGGNFITNITVAQSQTGLHYNFSMLGTTTGSASLRNTLSSSSSSDLPFTEPGKGDRAADHTVQPSAKATTGTASLSGTVLNDSTKNGIKGVELSLVGTDTTGRDIFRTVKTGTGGTYQFTQLNAGTYAINVVSPPAGFHADLTGTPGGSAGSVGGLILRNDQITNITLAAAASGTGYSFGEVPMPAAVHSGSLTLSGALADDTAGPGGTASDGITSDPSITGKVTDSGTITSLTASFGTNAVSITNQLQNGSFYLNPAVLNQIFIQSESSIALATAITDTTSISIKVTDASAIAVNSVLEIDSEKMQVTGVSGTTLTVVRGFDGTTAATHTAGTAVVLQLSDGAHTLHLKATDKTGHSTSVDVTFTLRTTVAIPTLTIQNTAPTVAPGTNTENFSVTFGTTGTQPQLTADGSGLTGTGTLGVTVTTTTAGGAGVNAVQNIALNGIITGGFFTLSFNGATTGQILWNTNATTLADNIQTALDLLQPPQVASVGGSDTTFTATFTTPGAEPTMMADSTNLQGGGVTVATTTTGDATTDAVQTITFDAGVNGGSFTLTLNGATTGPILWDANANTLAANIRAALFQLTGALDGVSSAFTGANGTSVITFGFNGVQKDMTATPSLNGTGTGITVATTTAGTSTTPAQQTVTFSGNITGGTFTLTFNGATTSTINWSPDPAVLAGNIQAALTSLFALKGASQPVNVTGTTSPNAQVTLTQGTNTPQTTTADSNGNFSFSVTLAGGANGITVTATDNAGNASQLTTALVNPIALTNPAAQTENLNTPVSSTATNNDQNVDLAGVFTDPNVAASVPSLITFNTSAGPMTVQLFDSQDPQSVANFFNYINSGAFNNDIFHRLATNPQVLQGGGFTFLTHPNRIVPVSVNPEIANEFNSNQPDALGTLAMAKQGGNPNSATSQFFFNTGDNSNSLGSSNNGGFTVFGKLVSGQDMRILNTLAAAPVVPKAPPSIDVNFSVAGPVDNMTVTNNLKGTNTNINIATSSPGSFPSINAVQTVTFSGNITGGTFKLTLDGATTDAITWTSNNGTLANRIATALNALTGVKVTTKASSPVPSKGAFGQLPLKNFTGSSFPGDASAGNFDRIKSISTLLQTDHLTFSILSNDNPSAVTASINANDWLQLHPLATGVAQITVQATDQYGGTPAQVTFTVNVTNPVTITQPSNQTNLDSDKVNLQITASTTTSSTTLTYTATGLPPGLSINSSTGLISGTIATNADSPNPYNVSVTASTGSSSASTTFNWTVKPVVTFASTLSNPPANTEGDTNISLQVPTATDANGKTITYSEKGLPPGLGINSSSGLISGNISDTAHTGSPYTVTITAGDGVDSASQTITWIVNPVVSFNTTIGTQTSSVGNTVNLSAAATDKNGTALTYTFTNLPTGLSINSSGQIIGTITAGADKLSPYPTTITAKDGTFSNTMSFTWIVHPVVFINPIANVTAAVGGNLNIPVTGTDGNGKVLTYSATGLTALGPNVMIDPGSGTISGTIGANVAPGTYTIAVKATDQTDSYTTTFTVTVTPVITMNAISDQASVVGASPTLQVQAQDADGKTLSYTTRHLPPGLNINSSGLISGTLTTAGTYNVTITASDGTNPPASRTFKWTVTA